MELGYNDCSIARFAVEQLVLDINSQRTLAEYRREYVGRRKVGPQSSDRRNPPTTRNVHKAHAVSDYPRRWRVASVL